MKFAKFIGYFVIKYLSRIHIQRNTAATPMAHRTYELILLQRNFVEGFAERYSVTALSQCHHCT